MMPHPERAADPVLGNTDSQVILEQLLSAVPGSITNFSYSGWPYSNSYFYSNTVNGPTYTNDRACFGTNTTGQYYLTTYASNNVCGSNSRSVLFYVNNCGYRLASNPAQNTITLTFDEPKHYESLPYLAELYSEKSTVPVSTIKQVEGKESIDLVDSNKLGFDVSKLPRGTYYLHLHFRSRINQEADKIRILLN